MSSGALIKETKRGFSGTDTNHPSICWFVDVQAVSAEPGPV